MAETLEARNSLHNVVKISNEINNNSHLHVILVIA